METVIGYTALAVALLIGLGALGVGIASCTEAIDSAGTRTTITRHLGRAVRWSGAGS